MLYRVRGISGVSVASGTTLGPIAFRFPRDVFVDGVQLLVRSGNPAELAALEMRIQDETFSDIISDGQGTIFTAAGAMLASIRGWHPFKVQRPVAVGDSWLISITNNFATPVVPILGILFSEPTNTPRKGSSFGVYGGMGGTA